MSLGSYDGPDGVLARLPKGSLAETPFARAFYGGFRGQIETERNIKRSPGDRHALSDCIKRGMAAATQALQDKYPKIVEAPEYGIQIDGLRPKKADYAFKSGNRVYVIEQKSNLSFNEFAQAAMEGLLAKRQDKEKVRSVALFNGMKQSRKAFRDLCNIDDRVMLDGLFVLVPDDKNYSIKEVEDLFNDIAAWLAG